MKKSDIIAIMDRQNKRLEDSYKKYPVHISENLFREGFDLGKKLGLITKESFEEIFPIEIMSQLEKRAAYYFSTWPEQLESYLRPSNLRQDTMVSNYLTAERKILNLKKMVIGERIIEIAKQKKLAKEVSFGPSTKMLIEALDELLQNFDVEFVNYEPIPKTGTGMNTFRINGTKISTHIEIFFPHQILDEVNTYLERSSYPYRVIQFEEIFSAWGLSYGVMLINKDSLDLENNPFIPFYSKNNLWVIDKEEITPGIRKRVETIAQEGLEADELFDMMNRN